MGCFEGAQDAFTVRGMIRGCVGRLKGAEDDFEGALDGLRVHGMSGEGG